MALPGSGTIYASQMRTEYYGGSGTVYMSQLYRGGGRVPNTPGNAAVPTSGTITFSNMYGSSAYAAITASGSLGSAIINGSWSGPVVTLYNSGYVNISWDYTDGFLDHNGSNVGNPSSLYINNGDTMGLRKIGPGSSVGCSVYDAVAGSIVTSGYAVPP